MSHSYSSGSKILHWSMALIILSMLALGFSMVQSLAVWQVEAIALHKSFGILAFILVIVRVVNRVKTPSPALPDDLANTQKLAAKATQIGLYVAMFAMPLSGYLMQNADNRPVTFFEWFALPNLISPNIELYAVFREIHGLAAIIFLVLITMHVCAALYHGIVRQDSVLSSMTMSSKSASSKHEE
ncbi:cytochrome b [Aliiglaciecola lipolytica]|uniref:Cytochrome b561 n=1 Tax=Aliiglaciecola lipolytica E3 TaxID=1127673 RepID=K6X020_9ALTE|nr:cytochrome b [Aliiglaciecola lipolytica]GAC14019.1 cytochrome b561 [Aliiglaciecola lipolytica E3]